MLLYGNLPLQFCTTNLQKCIKTKSSKLYSQSEGRGFESHSILDGKGSKQCHNRFLYSILVNLRRYIKVVAKYGTPKKNTKTFLKEYFNQ